MSAQRAEPEASSMLQDLTTAPQSVSGQTSLEPVDLPTTARRKRAGQTDLLITTLVVQIQEASVSQLLALTVLGNPEHLELTDHLLTVLTPIETHQTVAQEATTAQIAQPIVQHVQTRTVLGNLAHLELTDHLLTETIQIDHPEQEATTVQSVQHARTQIARGNPAHQDLIVQSVQGSHAALVVVQTPASMTGTEILSARTAFHAIAQEMKPLLALAIRTQTRRPSSKTRF
jgi:hypothetical protein